jgi:Cytochrome c-type biogenesis protein CcmF C-terminal
VYLSLVSAPADDAGQTVGVRVVVQPLIMWLWLGGLVMAAGTVLAAFPGRRRRNPIDPVSAPVPGLEPRDREQAVAPPEDERDEREPVEVGA